MSIFDSDILDSANNLLNKGANKVTSAIDSASNKMKLTEQQRKRTEACAALGAAIYAGEKDAAELRAKYEELFAAVDQIDGAIADLEAQIAAAEEQKASAARAAAGTRVCENCGATVADDALFCGNCGTKLPEVVAEPDSVDAPAVELVCPSCSTSVPEDADVCPACGTKL